MSNPTAPAPGAPAASSADAAPAKPATPAQPEAAAPAVPDEVELALEGAEKRKYRVEELRSNFLKGKNAAQMLTKADQRLRDAIEREKKAESLPDRLKKGDVKLLEEMGIDPRAFAESLLMPYIQREQLTPHEQAALAQQQRAEAAEAKLKALEDKDRETETEAKVQKHQQALGEQCVQALEKIGLPRESAPWAVKRMATLLHKADELELEVSPDEIATLVREDFLNEHRSITGTLSGEQIVALYGEDFVKKVRTYDLARLKAKQMPGGLQQPPIAKPAGQAQNGAPKKKYLTADEWDAEMKRRIQEG